MTKPKLKLSRPASSVDLNSLSITDCAHSKTSSPLGFDTNLGSSVFPSGQTEHQHQADSYEGSAAGERLAFPVKKGAVALKLPSINSVGALTAAEPSLNEPIEYSRPGRSTSLSLPFASPLTNLSANTDYSMAATTAFGFGVDALHDALPNKVVNNPLYRAAEVAADFTFHWGPAVLFHEWAHYREGVSLGWEPEVCGFNWFGGMVCYHDTSGATWADSGRASAAGMNNEEWIGRNYHTRISLGQPTYHDAIGMLLPDLQTTAYMGRTLTRDAARGDDNLSWARAAEAQGNSVSLESMFTKSLVTDLASVDNWYAAYRGIRYIATGERNFEPLTWSLGSVSGTFPKFSYFRTSNDEVIEGRLFLNPRRPGALELSGAVSLNEKDVRLGAGLHHVPLVPERLSVSPYVAATFSTGADFGVSGLAAGAELNAQLTDWLGVQGRIAYSSGDLLSNRAMHEPSGLRANVGLTLRLP